MKTLGIRDIIGPIMIGPSSSHTAGALRIALMTRNLLAAEPVAVEFRLYGSFAHTYHGHGTDRALLAGMLGFAAEDVRIRDSFALAAAHLALAGVGTLIGFDETVQAMDAVGRSLPFELRESALGGLAATPTAHALCAICPGCQG